MATITQENARQIRDPMIVQFDMDISEDSRINTYTPTTAYKSWDNTLGNVWPMRVLADLQDEGFLLDGTAEWYEDKTASAEAGKLGLRSNEGEPVSIRLVGNKTIKNITIGTQGVGTITYGSTVIQATGRDFINVNAQTINLAFTPTIEHGRMMVEFIFPGMDLEIRNDNLLKATVNLRCNLDPFATTLEASEIEIEMYYPNDIGDAFKYIGDDWPITYSAGYSGQMTEPRYFYLDDQVTWRDGVLTIHGIDSVPKLEETIKEGSLDTQTLDMLWPATNLNANWIEYLEARIPRFTVNQTLPFWNASREEYPIRKECTMRDLLQRVMSLTQGNNKDNRIAYVDAGWPTLQNNELASRTWTVLKEDLASIVETKYQNVERITAPGEELYDEILKEGSSKDSAETVEAEKDQVFTFDFEGGQGTYTAAYHGVVDAVPMVSFTPSEAAFKASKNIAAVRFYYTPILRSRGTARYINPNGKPGAVVEYEHIIDGRVITDKEYGSSERENVLSPSNIFKIERDEIEFDYKGDPRWQPYDKLSIVESLIPLEYFTVRISEIDITHEGGGTMAHVKCKYLSNDES